MSETIKIGVVGCGAISPAYFTFCKTFPILEIVACTDLIMERAQARAAEFGIPKVYTGEEMMNDPEIQIILNLTVPKAHAEVNMAAIKAGKHAYCEKPFATDRAEGRKVIEAAKERGLLTGCAPDTFFGGGIQTCRKLIDDGWIGQPIGATAFFTCPGHESWHQNPEFYYEIGGGPMLDMGPYYLTALVNLLGPIKRVAGSARITYPERTITSQPKYGKVIKVETPTHLSGVVDFASGAIGTLIMSFDVWAATLPRIEIFGTQGTLSVPDPNCFGGPVMIKRAGAEQWSEIPLTHAGDTGRGIGVADMAHGIVYGRPHRANGALAYHVLDVMQAFEDSSKSGRHIDIQSTVERPAPLPLNLKPGTLDKGPTA